MPIESRPAVNSAWNRSVNFVPVRRNLGNDASQIRFLQQPGAQSLNWNGLSGLQMQVPRFSANGFPQNAFSLDSLRQGLENDVRPTASRPRILLQSKNDTPRSLDVSSGSGNFNLKSAIQALGLDKPSGGALIGGLGGAFLGGPIGAFFGSGLGALALSEKGALKDFSLSEFIGNLSLGRVGGAAFGGIFGGPIGAVLGGFIGDKFVTKSLAETWSDLSAWGGKGLAKAKDWSGKAVEKTKDLAGKAWDGASYLAEKAWDGAKAVGRGVADLAESAWEGAKSLGRGVADLAEKAWDGAVSIGSSISEALGFSGDEESKTADKGKTDTVAGQPGDDVTRGEAGTDTLKDDSPKAGDSTTNETNNTSDSVTGGSGNQASGSSGSGSGTSGTGSSGGSSGSSGTGGAGNGSAGADNGSDSQSSGGMGDGGTGSTV